MATRRELELNSRKDLQEILVLLKKNSVKLEEISNLIKEGGKEDERQASSQVEKASKLTKTK